MSDIERGIQPFRISRRRILQLPAARGASRLEAMARTAEFVAQHPDQAISAAQRFATAIRNIFQPTPQPETPEIFKDRPENIELSLHDRAINAVTDLLQPHERLLRDWKLSPEHAIEPLADYLVKISDISILRASIVMVRPHPRSPIIELFDVLNDPPEDLETDSHKLMLRAIGRQNRGYGAPIDDNPTTQYEIEMDKHSWHFLSLMREGPYFANQIPGRILNGRSVEELEKMFKGMNEKKYLGTLLPIRE